MIHHCECNLRKPLLALCCRLQFTSVGESLAGFGSGFTLTEYTQFRRTAEWIALTFLGKTQLDLFKNRSPRSKISKILMEKMLNQKRTEFLVHFASKRNIHWQIGFICVRQFSLKKHGPYFKGFSVLQV